MSKMQSLHERRAARNRAKLAKIANGRPRLSVFRSSKHIYAQIIDDVQGVTVAAASSVEKEFGEKAGGNVDAAVVVGRLVAQRAVDAGIKDVVFDRGGYIYHGRVKALADAAREGGLNF
ncbi:MAG: 50S ribosomal protein L18 [Parvibaculaceae bacterium]|nr:50S ribosomal protein L18 [Parvibaculaceae bacterium]